MEGSLVNKRDALALYLSGTYCHRTGTRPTSCVTPRQPTIYPATDHKQVKYASATSPSLKGGSRHHSVRLHSKESKGEETLNWEDGKKREVYYDG